MNIVAISFGAMYLQGELYNARYGAFRGIFVNVFPLATFSVHLNSRVFHDRAHLWRRLLIAELKFPKNVCNSLIVRNIVSIMNKE